MNATHQKNISAVNTPSLVSIDSASRQKTWQQCLSEQIMDPLVLIERLGLSDAFAKSWKAQARKADREFQVKVSEHYLSLMEQGNPNDPLLLQVLADPAENKESKQGVLDPLGERALNRQHNLLRKYRSRVLVTVNSICPIHCRYCFRRHYDYPSSSTQVSIAALQTLVQKDSSIDEVILSGGDPLLSSDRQLAKYIEAVDGQESIKTLRIHTRTPIAIPNRLTKELISLLTTCRVKVVLVLHSNHANEISAELKTALEPLRSRVTLLNQSVLLRGVNDTSADLCKLSRALFEIGVLPYYLHLLDPVKGAMHFDVSDADGLALINEMRSKLAGYLVPRLVREQPGESSKTVIA